MILFNSGREVVDILTVYGYIPITRTILRPKDKEDIVRLKKLTGKKSNPCNDAPDFSGCYR